MKFSKWLETFVAEKDFDLSEYVEAGDGTMLQVGDVLSAFNSAPVNEQAFIKEIMVQIDFKNGDFMDFFQYAAKALDKTYKLGI